MNREQARATAYNYDTEEKALEQAKDSSEYYRLLNGTWKFSWAEKPADRISQKDSNFDQTDYDDNSWDDIDVPGNWQVNYNNDGTFKYDKPMYTNQDYPWLYTADGKQKSAGMAPTKYNPVGTYRKTFTIDPSWEGREVFIDFEGVSSNIYLYVNGKFIGYGEDSFARNEFNITKALNFDGDGKNTITAEVFRWCDGSYVENQDQIRLSGIFRDVYLTSYDKIQIWDFKAETKFVDSSCRDADLNVSVKLRNFDAADKSGVTVAGKLYDKYKNLVQTEMTSGEVNFGNGGDSASVQLSEKFTKPLQWNAEHPNLYTLVLTLLQNGKIIGITSTDVGFRQIEVANSGTTSAQVLINGKPITIKGVNISDINTKTGRYLTAADYRRDMEIMKRNNINAVRTSHYPKAPIFYTLCDEYGIYVLDEANVESHNGRSQYDCPGSLLGYVEACEDRAASLLERDKNYPCVLFWSPGNEAGAGDSLNSELKYFKEHDATRLVHYQGWNDNQYVDYHSEMYPDVSSVEKWGQTGTAPYIMCEYCHAMGNSEGSLSDYWNVIRSYKNLQGGFIWDFVDQSIDTPIPGNPSKTFWGYDGDWDIYSGDTTFEANGLLSPDYSEQPEMKEVKKVYQGIQMKLKDLNAKTVTFNNENIDTNTDAYEMHWSLLKDGVSVQSGNMSVDVDPLSSKDVVIPFTAPKAKAGEEYYLNISFATKQDTEWADAGYEVAYEQMALEYSGSGTVSTLSTVGMPDFQSVDNGEKNITITGDDFSVTFDKTTGQMTSYKSNGKEMLADSPEPNYWRALTDNDKTQDSKWENAVKNSKVTGVKVTRTEKIIYVTVDSNMPTASDSKNSLTYTIYSSGDVIVKNSLVPGASMGQLPRVGVRLKMAPGYENLSWYGRGPSDSYWDRKSGSDVGVYNSTVTDQFTGYIKPQETGNKTDVRWMAVTDGGGDGLMFDASSTMEASALHYTQEDIEQAAHPYQLAGTPNTVITLDYHQMGLGSGSCGQKVLDRYTLPGSQAYTFTFRMKPIHSAAAQQMTEDSKILLPDNTALLTDLKIDGQSVQNFSNDISEYFYSASSTSTIPQVTANAADSNVKVVVKQADAIPGDATVTATNASGYSKVYTIHFTYSPYLYLSDLNWDSATVGYSTIGKDKAVGGTKSLKVYVDGAAQTFDKGIGTHADSTIIYDISSYKVKEFQAVCGLDANESKAPSNGWVDFQVLVDGTVQFDSGHMSWHTSKNIDIALNNAKKLELIVSCNGSNSKNGHCSSDWADAKLILADYPTASVTDVTVTPDKANVQKGSSYQFSAQVDGTGDYSKEVQWSVNSTLSTIDKTGLLSVSPDEAADVLTVTATSAADAAKCGKATVAVTPAVPGNKVTQVTVTPDTATVQKGFSYQFSAHVNGTGNYSKEIQWSVNSALSMIDKNGLLSVSADETAGTLIVTARSAADSTRYGEASVSVITPSSHNDSSKTNEEQKKSPINPSKVTTLVSSAGCTVVTVETQPNTTPVITGDHAAVSVTVPADAALAMASATAEKPAQVNIIAPTSALTQQLQNSSVQSVELTIQAPDTVISHANANTTIAVTLESEVLKSARDAQKDLTINVAYAQTGKLAYSWHFSGTNLKNSTTAVADLNLAVSVESVQNNARISSVVKKSTADQQPSGLVLKFGNNGLLSSQATVRVYVGDQCGITPNSTVYVYYYNSEGNVLQQMLQNGYAVDANGYITFSVAHCSDYVVLPEAAANPYPVKSDTTYPISLKIGKTYTFEFTAQGNMVPSFTVGNGKLVSTSVKKRGNKYFYTVNAVGVPGQMTAIYSKLPGQKPIVLCYVSVTK